MTTSFCLGDSDCENNSRMMPEIAIPQGWQVYPLCPHVRPLSSDPVKSTKTAGLGPHIVGNGSIGTSLPTSILGWFLLNIHINSLTLFGRVEMVCDITPIPRSSGKWYRLGSVDAGGNRRLTVSRIGGSWAQLIVCQLQLVNLTE